MEEKETVMVLKVDLQCPCCYKEIKKIICKIPQIRNQTYDEKANTVTISVICCSPEKIRDKLYSKGRKVIKEIEIEDSDSKPIKESKESEKPTKPKVVEPEQPKQRERPKVIGIEQPKQPVKPKTTGDELPKNPGKPKVVVIENPNKSHKLKVTNFESLNKSESVPPVAGFPSVYSVQPYYGTYYEGHVGAPPPNYNGHYGYGYGHGYVNASDQSHVARFDDSYFSEENPQACYIM